MCQIHQRGHIAVDLARRNETGLYVSFTALHFDTDRNDGLFVLTEAKYHS